jgi:uncharacterized SAM-binding protein YcdF (DUF218 family)
MFFILSKTLGFFALPSNFLMAIGLVGLALLCTRFRRIASWLVVTSLVVIAFVGYSPLGNILILPLEQRFPPWNPAQGPPDGIVVLGGAIAPDISVARDSVALNDSAERITATAELARRYPNARIIFSGGSGSLRFDAPVEAPIAVKELEALGVAHDRITAEEQSRNTVENAVFSRLIAQPKPGERCSRRRSAAPRPTVYRSFIAAARYFALVRVRSRSVPWGTTRMSSTDLPAGLVDQPAQTTAEVAVATSEWAETALTVLFTAAAVLFISFLAVVTGLV